MGSERAFLGPCDSKYHDYLSCPKNFLGPRRSLKVRFHLWIYYTSPVLPCFLLLIQLAEEKPPSRAGLRAVTGLTKLSCC